MTALRITAAVSTWRSAFGLFQTFIEKGSHVPVLGMLRLRVIKGDGALCEVTLAGTNLDSLVVAKIGMCSVAGLEGDMASFLIPYFKIMRLFEALGSGDRLLTMTFRDSRLILSPPASDPSAFSAYSFDLMTEASGDGGIFDLSPDADFPDETLLHINPEGDNPERDTDFREAFRKAGTFISTEETRYYLNGIYMDLGAPGNPSYVVATDGHRLGCWPLPIDNPGWRRNPIVPRWNVRFISDHAGLVDVNYNPERNRVRFRWPTFTLEAKTIDGIFPDYKKVYPKPEAFAARVLVDQPALRRLVDRLVARSDENFRTIGCLVRPGAVRQLVFCHDSGAVETIDCEIVEGVETCNTWNGAYFKSIVDTLNGEPKVLLSLSADGKNVPAMIGTAADPSNMLVMPYMDHGRSRETITGLLADDAE